MCRGYLGGIAMDCLLKMRLRRGKSSLEQLPLKSLGLRSSMRSAAALCCATQVIGRGLLRGWGGGSISITPIGRWTPITWKAFGGFYLSFIDKVLFMRDSR